MESTTALFSLIGLGVLVWLVVLLIFCFAKIQEEIKMILGMILIWGGLALLIGGFSIGEKLLR